MRPSFCALLASVLHFYILYKASASPVLRLREIQDKIHALPEITHYNRLAVREDGKPILRILPLGASITKGVADTPKDNESGYRKPLREVLRSRGYPVNMIGCEQSGDFKDNEHEGHPGAVISEVRQSATCAMPFKPNLVLINLGTNDAGGADSRGGRPFLDGAYDRMKDLVEYIFKESEGVVVILSTLLPNGNPKTEENVKIINEGYKRVVKDLAAAGRKIQLADMHPNLQTGDLADGIHPKHESYPKMAKIWLDAFNEVEKKNWLKNPIDTPNGNGVCLPHRGPVKTAESNGFDNGSYQYKNESKGSIAKFSHPSSIAKGLHFAQLVNHGGGARGQEVDELIRVLDSNQRDKLPYISYKLNTGGKLNDEWTAIDVKKDCPAAGVHWGDVNGDDLDDFICIDEKGGMSVSINKGGNPPTFDHLGEIRKGESSREKVRIADIDGDGRVDYCVVAPDMILCWRNGGSVS